MCWCDHSRIGRVMACVGGCMWECVECGCV